ncbi:hypothetical protein PMAYCL1PPCAC_18055, partial [Pristionchus mayeri]
SFFSSFFSGIGGAGDLGMFCIADFPSPTAVTIFFSSPAGGLGCSFFLFFLAHTMRNRAICESKLMVMSSVVNIAVTGDDATKSGENHQRGTIE